MSAKPESPLSSHKPMEQTKRHILVRLLLIMSGARWRVAEFGKPGWTTMVALHGNSMTGRLKPEVQPWRSSSAMVAQ